MQQRTREQNLKRFLDEQMREKQLRLAVDKQKSKELAASWQREAEQQLIQEKQKLEVAQKRNRLVSQDLVKQMAERRNLNSRDRDMDNRELLLNKRILDEATSIAPEESQYPS